MIETIVLASTNPGKLKELREMLTGKGITIHGLNEFADIPEAPETGSTFAENARQKALWYSQRLQATVLADDSGLEVDALNGKPGIYSARYAGVEGKDRDQANNRKLIANLTNIPQQQRTARFRCAICLATPKNIRFEADGVLEGLIIDTPCGSNGFGYDPIVYLPDHEKTVAELTSDLKNAISHRGNALIKLMAYLSAHK